jgi:hypothetical protein
MSKTAHNKNKDWFCPGLPDFPWCNIPKLGKIYQMATKYNKWPQNNSNGRKIDQMAVKYINNVDTRTSKCIQNGMFGLKI